VRARPEIWRGCQRLAWHVRVLPYTVGAGGSGVDGHDVSRRSRLGTGTMMDGVGDNDEAWHGTMAQAEKVDRVTEGRMKMRRYINA
jgi:hypothetical protein